jgi:hypothetical protein
MCIRSNHTQKKWNWTKTNNWPFTSRHKAKQKIGNEKSIISWKIMILTLLDLNAQRTETCGSSRFTAEWSGLRHKRDASPSWQMGVTAWKSEKSTPTPLPPNLMLALLRWSNGSLLMSIGKHFCSSVDTTDRGLTGWRPLHWSDRGGLPCPDWRLKESISQVRIYA